MRPSKKDQEKLAQRAKQEQEWFAFFQSLPYFYATPATELRDLVKCCTPLITPIGKPICPDPSGTDTGTHMCFLLSGQATITRSVQVQEPLQNPSPLSTLLAKLSSKPCCEPHVPGTLARPGYEVAVKHVAAGQAEPGMFSRFLGAHDAESIDLQVRPGVTRAKVDALIAVRQSRIDAMLDELGQSGGSRSRKVLPHIHDFVDERDVAVVAQMRCMALCVRRDDLLGCLGRPAIDAMCVYGMGDTPLGISLRQLQEAYIRGEAMNGFRKAVRSQVYSNRPE